jgi:hypothetical protein
MQRWTFPDDVPLLACRDASFVAAGEIGRRNRQLYCGSGWNTRLLGGRFASVVCLPADAGGNVVKLPASADVEDFNAVPIPQLLAERRGLRAPVGV